MLRLSISVSVMVLVLVATNCNDTSGPNAGLEAEGAYRLTAVGERHSYPALAYVAECLLEGVPGVDSVFVQSDPSGRLDLTNDGDFRVTWPVQHECVTAAAMDSTTESVLIEGTFAIIGQSMGVTEASNRVLRASFSLDEKEIVEVRLLLAAGSGSYELTFNRYCAFYIGPDDVPCFAFGPFARHRQAMSAAALPNKSVQTDGRVRF